MNRDNDKEKHFDKNNYTKEKEDIKSDNITYNQLDNDYKNNDADDTDKYLAMEQKGVQYTADTDPTISSDQMDFNESNNDDKWNSEGGNSKNSEAFNQDDYILNDNVDLDEDQNKSISSDDEDFEEANERY